MATRGTPRPLEILIVEDSPDGAESLALLLQICGHRPRIALNGNQATQVALLHAPEVVLMDIELPGADGYEVAQQLCRLLTYQPLLVAVSGYGQDKDVERARQAGFARYFLKPVDPTEFLAYLDSYAASLLDLGVSE
jgi:CheY-like chemotaxis protein